MTRQIVSGYEIPLLKKGVQGKLLQAVKNSLPPPLALPEGLKKWVGLRFVIPAKAGIQSFQSVTNFLDPGFHRGDGSNSIFSHPLPPRGRVGIVHYNIFTLSPCGRGEGEGE